METAHTDIRIYVACLAAYNNGHLHGAWIDATQDAEDIQTEISAMLASSPMEQAEEYAIYDFEGFGGYRVSEYEGITELCEIAQFITKHDKLGAELLNYYTSPTTAERAIEDHYAGCFESVAEFAREITKQTQDVPEHLANYIDYDAMGRDMQCCDIFTIETAFNEIHVFWEH